MTKQAKMIQHTEWGDKCEMIETTKYGFICMKLWLEKEKERIEKTKGRRAEIRSYGKKGRIALFVNEVL